MKRTASLFIISILTKTVFYLFSTSTYAQEIDPSTWSGFVKSDRNPVVADTFLIQTFNEHPTDNWEYRMTGNSSLFDARTAGIKDASEGYSLKLPPESSVQVDIKAFGTYKDVRIFFIYAAHNLQKNEILYMTVDRQEKPAKDMIWLDPPRNNYSVSFQQVKNDAYIKRSFLQLMNNPFHAALSVGSGTGEGYYAIDSIYAVGDTRNYSLFTGSGEWNDKAGWSDNPVLRNRHAMIHGNVQVNQHISCDHLFIGKGQVGIQPGQTLHTNQIIFCDNNASLSSGGTLSVDQTITVHKTFEEKGRWYFISFPFDIYAEGIDPNFELKDDNTTDGGNYFYLQTYNGEQRAIQHNSETSWEVVPAETINDSQPVFHKNKGYLIAIDEQANKQTLSFTSRPGDIPEDFGQNGKIEISTPFISGEILEEHYGWHLCGNPLPAPLILSQISPNRDLDGYAYIYEGNTFRAYPLNSEYAIPAFSAFFVKAERDTELIVSSSLRATDYRLITSGTMSSIKEEPQSQNAATGSTSFHKTTGQTSFIKGNMLFTEGLQTSGKVFSVDFMGRIIWQKEIDKGSSQIELPVVSGACILHIETSSYKAQHKFISSR